MSYTWVQKAKRRKHRRRQERRPMPGMLLHIDGSKHQWFGDERWYDPIVILDDATSKIYYGQLVEEESTRTACDEEIGGADEPGKDAKGTAFRRTTRSDLDWVFTVQTERVVAKDNTVAIA